MLDRRVFHRMRSRFVIFLTFVALGVTACSSSNSMSGDPPNLADLPDAQEPPTPGQMAADFTVTTRDGSGFSLSEHLESDGRPVFLNMWASWCPPCKEEMPDIDAASEVHKDVKFVGVSVNDDPAAAVDFAASIGIGYTIGFDEDGNVANAYEVVGLPASYIISAGGVILERIFGVVTEADIDDKLAHWFP